MDYGLAQQELKVLYDLSREVEEAEKAWQFARNAETSALNHLNGRRKAYFDSYRKLMEVLPEGEE